jgi:class 3 adenylate cyclase/pimeloyl-ACP methyl ester carboxylesterase
MDAPPIQYAQTADGVSIAFWTLGEGPPLVILPNLLASNVQLEWEADDRRTAFGRLAQRATVIRYDWRGMGLSQRDRLDSSAEAASLDLEAVVDRLALERFALYGTHFSADVAFSLAGSHAARLSHLIFGVPPLPDTYYNRLATIEPLIEQDWELFTEIFSRLIMGWDSSLAAQRAAWIRGAHTPSSFRSGLDAMAAFSPQPFLAAVQTPALILYGLGSERESGIARTLAGGIAGAHMVGVPGWPLGSSLNETVVTAILDFINTAPSAPGRPIAAPHVDISAVRTIVFTDVEGSTALNERLGDEGARKVLREHERLTREALGAHGGSEVKAMGDGFMAWFPSATRAVECAIALQKAFDERNRNVGARQPRDEGRNREPSSVASPLRPTAESRPDTSEPIRVRIGINAGEPIAEGDDLFGASVIATARITAQASGGQILASDVVRQLLAGKGFSFADQGEHSLKGFDEPARLYEVRWQENA